MKFNSRGDVVMGVGDKQVSINNVAIDSGGTPGWLDDDRVVYQHDGQTIRWPGAALVDSRPANTLLTGGGVWAAWANGTGVFASTGLAANPARLVDVGPDGAIAYLNENDWSITRVRELNGSEWVIPATLPQDVKLLGQRRAVWHYNHVLGMMGLVPHPAVNAIGGPQIVFLNGEAWLLAWRWVDGPLTLSPLIDPDRGYRVSAPGESAWGYDSIVLNGKIRVGWARGAGEQPGTTPPFGYEIRDIDTLSPRVDLRVAGQTIPPPTPPPVVHPPVPPVITKDPSMPTAPNEFSIVKQVFVAHPEINAMQDGERGALTTLVVQALNGLPWGRKAKNKEKTVFSDDALCYRLSDGRFEIYDIMRGFNPGDPKVPNDQVAQWSYVGVFSDGENGWFTDVGGGGVTVPGPQQSPPVVTGSGAQLDAQVAVLQALIQDLRTRVKALEARPVVSTSQPTVDVKAAINGMQVGLKSDTGKYVTVDHGKGNALVGDRNGLGPWETLTIEVVG